MMNTEKSVVLMLRNMGAKEVGSPPIEIFPEESDGVRWLIDNSVSELASYADSLESAGVEAGVGGKYCPGVALLSIHIQEKIATASAGVAKKIKIYNGRIKVC